MTADFALASAFVEVKFGENFSDGDLREHCLALDIGLQEEVITWDRPTLISKLRGSAFEEFAYD